MHKLPGARPAARSIRTAACLPAVALAAVLIAILGTWMHVGTAQATQATDQFWDVDGHWVTNDGGENYLQYVYEQGLMTGLTDAGGNPIPYFDPDGQVTRGQIATVLFRFSNPGDDSTSNPGHYGAYSSFYDVPAFSYYTAAIQWCAGAGVVTGDTLEDGSPAGTFRPDDPVTRQELAVMLFRFANAYEGGHDINEVSYGGFYSLPDAGYASDFATTALAWCYGKGLLTGSVDNGVAYLLPHFNATRAQLAKMITVLTRDVLGTPGVFALLYSDGSLVLSRNGIPVRGSLSIDRYGHVGTNGELLGRWDDVEHLNGVIPWVTSHANDVRSIVVASDFAPVFASRLFAGLPNLVSADLSGVDLSRTTDISYLFWGDSSLASLDLTGVDVAGGSNAYGIILGCTALQSVVLDPYNRDALAVYLQDSDGTAWVSSDGLTYTRPAAGERAAAAEPVLEPEAAASSAAGNASAAADVAVELAGAAADTAAGVAGDSAVETGEAVAPAAAESEAVTSPETAPEAAAAVAAPAESTAAAESGPAVPEDAASVDAQPAAGEAGGEDAAVDGPAVAA